MLRRGLLVVAITSCTAEVPVIEVSADDPLPAELRAGDIVRKGPITVVVPEPGESVFASVEQEDGSVLDFGIDNPLDGPVRLATQIAGDDMYTGPGYGALAVANPCGDGAYNLEGFHWASDYHWLFHASSTPSGVSASAVETGLQVAANAITHERNSCGLTDRVSATNSYGGHTAAAPNISAAGTCGTRDGKNVIGFGGLPAGTLGLTCAWFGADHVALEADVKLSTRYHWFTQGVPSGCSNRYGIEQVGTHELGHVYGLAHVGQAKHGELTMSPYSYPCRNEKLSLGLGDVRGLRALY
jgi:hypothetical protein